MDRKGQVEFIAIIGLLFVIAVAVFYAYQSGLLTPVVSPDVSLAEDSVKNLIRAGAYHTLTNMSLYGGYLNADSFQLGSLTFNGKEVPYWQKNGQILYPDLHANFIEGVRSYLAQNKDSFANAYTEEYGKELVIGEPSASANFMPDKIDLLVNMHTTLDGNPVPQPYVISVPTRLEEIYDFSVNFLAFSGTNRPLEYFTLASMLMSPMEDGFHTVPTFLFLTKCGEMVFKNWWDVKDGLDHVIKTTLAHTYMPGKYPQNVMKTTSYLKYSIPPINGKDYENLDITFHLPDNFELTSNNLQFTPDPIYLQADMIPMTTSCQSEPVFVNYFILYPVIVRVKDPLNGNSFRFATEVFIFNNTPGDWVVDISGYESGLQREICHDMGCSIDIDVIDSDRNPVPYAAVSFMGCALGRTDSSGRFVGDAPCGIGPLEVYERGYGKYSEMTSSDYIRYMRIVLYKEPVVNLYLHEVVVQNLTDQYLIRKDGIDYINSKHKDEIAIISFFSYFDNQFYQLPFETKMGTLKNVPAGEYVVSGSLMSEGLSMGTFAINYTLTEEMDGGELHIYLPYLYDFGDINVSDYARESLALAILLERCGLGPIRESPASDFDGCVVRYDEL